MIDVLVPVLGRPQKVWPLIESFQQARIVPSTLHFAASPGDRAELDALYEALDRTGGEGIAVHVVGWEPGRADFAMKCNYLAGMTDAEWLFQGADDIVFTPGWDSALMAHADQTGARVIGTWDGGNNAVMAGRHSTHTLVARSYIDDPGASMDGPGSVFSVAYSHQACDNEFIELAQRRGEWSFCADARVIHEHPFWNRRRGMDATYEKGLRDGRADIRLFQQRRRSFPPAGR